MERGKERERETTYLGMDAHVKILSLKNRLYKSRKSVHTQAFFDGSKKKAQKGGNKIGGLKAHVVEVKSFTFLNRLSLETQHPLS